MNDKSRFNVSRETTRRAQKLRREARPAEKKLWLHIGRRQIGGHKFRRQYPAGPYFLDFYCPALKLCVEIDGDSHSGDAAVTRDQRRTDYLSAKGITVMRFSNQEIYQDIRSAADAVATACFELSEGGAGKAAQADES